MNSASMPAVSAMASISSSASGSSICATTVVAASAAAMVSQHAGRAAIQHGEQVVRRRALHAHEPRRAGHAGREQRCIGRLPVEGRVLLVHHQEIEAEAAHDLRPMQRRGLEEAADQDIAAEQPRAETIGAGCCRHQAFPILNCLSCAAPRCSATRNTLLSAGTSNSPAPKSSRQARTRQARTGKAW
jgi:hypothetical protein